MLGDPVPASLSGLELRILNGSDGTAVGSFGSGGVVSIRDYSMVRAMTIDSSAVFIAAQTPASPSGSQWHIEKRSTSDGSLVAAFGSSGVIVGTFVGLPFGIVVHATAVYIAGYEVVAGPSGNNTAWRIEKRDITDGTLIPGFGVGGVITSNPSDSSERPWSIAIDSTNLYVAGATQELGNNNFAWRPIRSSHHLTRGS